MNEYGNVFPMLHDAMCRLPCRLPSATSLKSVAWNESKVQVGAEKVALGFRDSARGLRSLVPGMQNLRFGRVPENRHSAFSPSWVSHEMSLF